MIYRSKCLYKRGLKMNEKIKNVLEYLREIYKLKTKVVNNYTKYEKVIDIKKFDSKYGKIVNAHVFSKDLVNENEYFSIKYIKNKKSFYDIPFNLVPYIGGIYGDYYMKVANIPDDTKKYVDEFLRDNELIKEENELINNYNFAYEYLYNVYKRIKELEEKIEVVLCKGLFEYRENDESEIVQRHIFEVPLEIDINQNENVIKLQINE